MFTDKQVEELLKPIDKKRVQKDPKNFSHLEAWDVRRRLIEIFGHGGWSFGLKSLELVSEESVEKKRNGGTYQAWTVIYRASGALIVGDCLYEDSAAGAAQNLPSRADAHDNALKSAISGALKRCAVNLGDQFGLSLYKNGSTDQVVRPETEAEEPQTEAEASQEPAETAESMDQVLLSLGALKTVDECREKWLDINRKMHRGLYTQAQWNTFSRAVETHKNRITKQAADTAESNLEQALQQAGVDYVKTDE